MHIIKLFMTTEDKVLVSTLLSRLVIMNLKGKLKILDKVLSEGASIKFPGDPDFYPNTIRWSEYAAPQPGAVINVATETDVQKTLGEIFFELLMIGIVLRRTGGDS